MPAYTYLSINIFFDHAIVFFLPRFVSLARSRGTLVLTALRLASEQSAEGGGPSRAGEPATSVRPLLVDLVAVQRLADLPALAAAAAGAAAAVLEVPRPAITHLRRKAEKNKEKRRTKRNVSSRQIFIGYSN